MKNIFNQTELLIDQLRNLNNAELLGHYAIEKNVNRVNAPELEKLVDFSPPKVSGELNENTNTFEKPKLYIKNMASNRCKMTVKEELKKLGLHFIIVDSGEVEIMENISIKQREQLKIALHSFGLELLDGKRAVLIGKLKKTIIEMIHNMDEMATMNFSDYLSEKLNHDYTYLANLFSEVHGTTICQFIISHKIERVKELLIYGELNITEIAWQMDYSSVAHLSNQFKKVTGLSPTHFKNLRDKNLNPIE